MGELYLLLNPRYLDLTPYPRKMSPSFISYILSKVIGKVSRRVSLDITSSNSAQGNIWQAENSIGKPRIDRGWSSLTLEMRHLVPFIKSMSDAMSGGQPSTSPVMPYPLCMNQTVTRVVQELRENDPPAPIIFNHDREAMIEETYWETSTNSRYIGKFSSYRRNLVI